MDPDEMARHWDKLYRVAVSMLKNDENACDAIQEAYVKALSNQGFMERSQSYTWMHRIVMNVCVDMMRKAKRHSECMTDDFDSMASSSRLPDDAAECMEQARALGSAFQKIETELQEFLLDDMDRDRSAKGSHPSSVRGKIVRTRKRAVEAMQREMNSLSLNERRNPALILLI